MQTYYSDDDMLMLSGIQYFVFCPRQWALIHLDQQWSEIIDKKSDSIRFYLLGNNWQRRVEQIGSLASIDVENDIFVI